MQFPPISPVKLSPNDPLEGSTTADIQFGDGPGFLDARVAGAYSLEAMLSLFERVAAEARTRNARRVLVDLIGLTGEVPDLDRYDMGRRAAESLAHIERLAMIRGPHLRYTGFAIDVAQNRGLDARAFLERAEAIRWLTGE